MHTKMLIMLRQFNGSTGFVRATLGKMAADRVHEQTGQMFDCCVATKRRTNEMKGYRIKVWKVECPIEASDAVGYVDRSACHQTKACFRRSPNR